MNTGMRYTFGKFNNSNNALFEYNELSGNLKSSNSEIEGVLNGSIIQGVTGIYGNCYEFNNTGYINLGVNFFNVGNNDFSIVWNEFPYSNQEYDETRFSKNNSNVAETNRFFIDIDDNSIRLVIDERAFRTGYLPVLNQWSELAFVKTSTEVKFYVNKTLLYTSTGDYSLVGIDNDLNFYIGARIQNATDFFHGKMDRTQFFNRAISQTELNNL
jgi:hypothetical protein